MSSSRERKGFIDTHSHILPGIDDGPETFAQCLAAAQDYLAIGVECVIATPHWIQGTGWAPSPTLVRDRVAETQELLAKAGLKLRILPGMEITLTDYLCGHFAPSDFVGCGDQRGFLVEFPLNSPLTAPTAKAIRTLLARGEGCRFIIAHPERCVLFQDDLQRLKELVAGGMLTQVNISSILGLSGPRARNTARTLLTGGLVHFLGTDSHGRPGRMPPRPAAMAELESRLGAEAVARGFRDNPRRLLLGEEIPPLAVEWVAPHPDETLARPAGILQGFLRSLRHQ